ncbi:hypothetical protein TNIN_339331 [Trichonephila inaurata madagascariensis]|uniref:Uncharacterized protein n=1 Tax=Trichonephila inaurata madagascariensis TaxID=2747483 RepID=A0A8X7C5J5_9ARAC|nr:hypothetical protein TNIN_339331 [Trichonephila inaurata madagascariensis]
MLFSMISGQRPLRRFSSIFASSICSGINNGIHLYGKIAGLNNLSSYNSYDYMKKWFCSSELVVGFFSNFLHKAL